MVRDLKSPRWQLQKVGSIALISFVMLGVVSQTSDAATASPSLDRSTTAQLTQSQSGSQLPRRVARTVRRDLAQRFNLSLRDIEVVSFSRETWSDGCLGLAAPNERCTMALVPGWQIELTNGEQNWVYRTDRRAQVIKLETADAASLPPPIVDQLFETIARETKVPANTLKVVESQPRTWDGCLGIFEPGQACTKIAISGYRVIVMGDRQNWVYHVDQEGSQIVQNATASSSPPITPSFLPPEAQPSMPDGNIVFQMTVSGGLSGDTTKTVLTSEGIVYRSSTGIRAAAISEPTVIKRLSQSQIQQFQQLLEQQKFPNLNGMSYLTSAALADYPTTVVQAMGSTVAYIDLEPNSLPQSLQTIIQAWDQL